MQISLRDRTAMVTGGSRGLGLATAHRFVASGASVAVVARDAAVLAGAVEQLRAAGAGSVVGIAADVATADGVRHAYHEAMAQLGRLDIVVNNAGSAAVGPAAELADDVLQADLDLKLFAALRLSRLVWPQMVERRWGRIINVLAIAAKAPPTGTAPTSISRAAGMSLTKLLAGDGAPHNILVNALLVGSIESDQTERMAREQGVAVADFLARSGERIPLGRVGRAAEFADVACFLASEASSYVTGTAINVDGGLSPVV
ncbi:SDR family oxidoreductase [Nakamurella lactea]|uniref:SDR family oxidoreductase n=1 Tax=Nakamurella lactea TaxID=459515 RepID=UPI00048DDF5C|nr:SDR family oxidoreductase [Nakamurella lactea]